jgi:glutamine synthetase
MSFGSSRRLWEDAALVPADTVLYGNLPTKRFSGSDMTAAEVERLAQELVARMASVPHPFILGSECDVLSVPGKEGEILAKVDAANAVHDEAKKADTLCSKVKPKMDEIREYVDELENLVDDELWPLPKFWEMLFIS